MKLWWHAFLLKLGSETLGLGWLSAESSMPRLRCWQPSLATALVTLVTALQSNPTTLVIVNEEPCCQKLGSHDLAVAGFARRRHCSIVTVLSHMPSIQKDKLYSPGTLGLEARQQCANGCKIAGTAATEDKWEIERQRELGHLRLGEGAK